MYANAEIKRRSGRVLMIALAVGFVFGTLALGYSIAPEKVDRQKIFYGTPEKFEKPAEVDYEKIVRTTPEYQEIQKKNVERGSGRYWILLSQASDHAVRAICKVGEETEHDLIAARGYLGGLDPPIPAVDVTDVAINNLKQDKKKSSK